MAHLTTSWGQFPFADQWIKGSRQSKTFHHFPLTLLNIMKIVFTMGDRWRNTAVEKSLAPGENHRLQAGTLAPSMYCVFGAWRQYMESPRPCRHCKKQSHPMMNKSSW